LGRKVHPIGFRTGIIRDWQAKWYADKHYVDFLHEDLKLRQAIQSRYNEAGISLVEIERQANKVSVTIHTARPGVVIGRGGQRVDEVRHYLEDLVGKRIQLNIVEIQQPELDAHLVAKSVAEQIERRVAFRRAMKQAVFRTIQAGAKGVRISCAGRLGGAEIARRQTMHEGQVPLHTLRADIDYGLTEARTTLGRIGVKVWIYKGDILPEPGAQVVEEEAAELAAGESTEAPAATEPEAEVAEPEAEVAEPEADISPEEKEVTLPESEAVEEAAAELAAGESTEAPVTTEPEAEVAKPEADVSTDEKEVTLPESEAVEEAVAELAASESTEAPVTTEPEAPVTTEPEAEVAKPEADISPEEKDVTTEAGEIPQDS